MDEFLSILESHVLRMRTAGATINSVRINDVEAGRCGLADVTVIMGMPIIRDNSLQIGRVRLDCTGREFSQYEFFIPVRFTED